MKYITAASRPPLALVVALLLSVTGVLVTAAPATAATPPDTKGKDFWLAIPNGRAALSEQALRVSITSATPTSGTVAIPGLNWSDDFTVSPPASTQVTLPPGAMLGEGASGDPQDLGIHVTAEAEVSITARFQSTATSGLLLALPTDVLTTEYLALAWTAPGFDPNTMFSEFAVVATEDDTAVTITTRAATTSGKSPGTTWTTNLAKGEALPVVSKTGDLTGSVITATAPVAVFGGHSCANVPNNETSFCDYVMEQLPGTATWGTSFLTVPLKSRSGDTFRVLAAEDGTTVSIDGGVVANLDRGEFHQQILGGASRITADRPILVAQYANGSQFDKKTGDPVMIVVPSTEQFLDSVTFGVPSEYQSNFINVVAPAAAVGTVQLDSVAIPSSSFTPIGDSGFSGAQVEVTTGGHVVTAPRPVGVTVYGFGFNEGYGFPAGFAFPASAFVAGVTLTPQNQTVQVNGQACVTAVVTDRQGAGLAGVPISLQVTGANPQQASGTSGDGGQYAFCYTGTAVGTDTVSADLRAAAGTTATAQRELSATATIVWEAAPAPPPAPPTPPPAPPVAQKPLPIKVKGAKSSPVSLGADGKAVLARAITTNKYGRTAIRNRCLPVARTAAGEVRFCDVKVSKNGKVTVRSTGFDAVRVTVIVRATPRAGKAEQWRASIQRTTWVVRP